VKPFDDVAKATMEANRAGLTTDDFLKIVDKMAEFAKIVSSLPPSAAGSALLDDTNAQRSSRVSPIKMILLSGFGFFERTVNLLASSAALVGPAEGYCS
jgi:hypothetical protein